MNKILLLTLTVLLLASACTNNDLPSSDAPDVTTQDEPLYEGKIVQVEDKYIMLAKGSADLCTVSTENVHVTDWQNNSKSLADLKPGMLVQVGFDGNIMETYPAQLGHPSSIRIMGEEDDMTGLYLSAVDQLYSKDTALNDSISYIAFDLSQLNNMSDSEKSALIWLSAERYSLEPLSGTFEELCQQGYIDADELFFENGILIEIKDEPIKTINSVSSFQFDISKWRSGRGAYMFIDCTATKEAGAWTFSIGSEMIS